jgi:hypothetical protein
MSGRSRSLRSFPRKQESSFGYQNRIAAEAIKLALADIETGNLVPHAEAMRRIRASIRSARKKEP